MLGTERCGSRIGCALRAWRPRALDWSGMELPLCALAIRSPFTLQGSLLSWRRAVGPIPPAHDLFHAFLDLATRQHHPPAAALTLQPNVRPQPIHAPLIAAARMRLAQAHAVFECENEWSHELTSAASAGFPPGCLAGDITCW